MQCGVIATVFAGAVGTAELVWGKVLKDMELPYFRVLGISALLSSLTFALVAKFSVAPFPKGFQAVWAMLRAVCGCLTFLTMVIAVQIGAGPGDVAALTSVNIVFAALLGHLFLKERLRLVHISALVLSIVGAILIAKPEIFFGASESGMSSFVGNLLALVSGFLLSCVFICARKSADISISHMACYTALVASVLGLTLPLTPFVEEVPFSVGLASPLLLLGLVAATLAIVLLAITLDTVGSVLCPAAVSATVRTASSMLCGYVAQTVLFDMVPEVLTVVGAVLMLGAVVIMASVRVSPQQAPSTTEGGQDVTSDVISACSDDTATESLASFAASEFAEWEPHVATRLRRSATQSKAVVAARTIGSSLEGIAAVAAIAV